MYIYVSTFGMSFQRKEGGEGEGTRRGRGRGRGREGKEKL